MTYGKRTYDVTVYKPVARIFRVLAADPDEAARKLVAAEVKEARTMVEVSWEEGPRALPRKAAYFCEGGTVSRVDGRVY